MDFLTALFARSLTQTLVSLSHNWPYLLASILVAASLKAYMDVGRVTAFLQRHQGAGVVTATAAAVATPFCSCGTTAVVLGMMATTMPLAPIVAFMVASPLSSPEELFYSAGLFGWPFAIAYFAASILLGLGAGGLATILERRGFLKGQARLSVPPRAKAGAEARTEGACGCGSPGAKPDETSALGDTKVSGGAKASRPAHGILGFLASALEVSRKLVPMFLGFAFLGYLLNGLIPASWISTLFGSGRVYGVPLAATIGLPLYVSSEASLPLVRGLLDSGMSQGAIMAFLIAGSGTSVGAITGALTIARWRVVGLVAAVLWAGAILAGYAFDALAATGLA